MCSLLYSFLSAWNSPEFKMYTYYLYLSGNIENFLPNWSGIQHKIINHTPGTWLQSKNRYGTRDSTIVYEHSLEILRSKTRVLFAVIDGKQQKVFLAESMKDRRLKVMKKAPSSPMQGRRKGIEPQKRSMFFCFFPRDSQQTLRETRNSNQMSVYYSFFCFVHGTPSHEYIYIYISVIPK